MTRSFVRVWSAWTPLAVGVLLLSCKPAHEWKDVKDTEGRSFRVQCGPHDQPRGTFCDRAEPSHPPFAYSASTTRDLKPNREPGLVVTSHHFAGICEGQVAKEGWGGSHVIHACRALVCTVDADCPDAGDEKAICGNGLCTYPTIPVGFDDISLLCNAKTGADWDSPVRMQAAMKLEQESHCQQGGGCTMPPRCLEAWNHRGH